MLVVILYFSLEKYKIRLVVSGNEVTIFVLISNIIFYVEYILSIQYNGT